ncbi:hypothetical protein MPTK1_7g02550 [Marchantia polymorpha subsp. ruderalis]|uniref:Bifunctional inhibitor/plant lipid transfer protein/seed storage helical domain-containing protein n=2 Tax=Marchantia polymorpha TaxID=3197 RepID=A0AAF6BVF0_MARPO|nr:hypothetical protein MARPO_0088s0033 [Marchantia polymorpha]BBN15984.1 hypothetical protein Mp_7g02550 [Marchantia polymorpha subsp. ruderalis]|eukprot:PTQ33487.1 hypothetical protein MARPO_0088s0033 [Marchantia polymorpha]
MGKSQYLNASLFIVMAMSVISSQTFFTVNAQSQCVSICTNNATQYIRQQLDLCAEDVTNPQFCPRTDCCYAVGNLRHTNNACICRAAQQYFSPDVQKEYNRIIYGCSGSERNITCLL